jgi:hypothetical protein
MLSQMLQRIGLSRSYFYRCFKYEAVSKFSTPGQIDLRAGGERCFIISGRCLALDAFRKAYQDSLFTG